MSVSNLSRVIASGAFALTVEIGPPVGADPDAVRKKAELLRGLADGYNVTDNQTAVVRMSSMAAAKILLEEGLEPVLQMTVRDRNRIALQSDILGASSMGLHNCLCLSGDHQQAGGMGKLKGHAGAKNVFDIDSIQLISTMKAMRDDSALISGDSVTKAPELFIGAVWTPLAPPEDFRVLRLAKKVNAGADFIQTQAVYDIPKFTMAVENARQMGLTDKTAILPGVIVPRSAGMLRYMNANVPGINVPDDLIERMANAKDKKEEGIAVTVELIQAIKGIKGVKGVHLQAIEAEHMLPEVIERAGLLPRPGA